MGPRVKLSVNQNRISVRKRALILIPSQDQLHVGNQPCCSSLRQNWRSFCC